MKKSIFILCLLAVAMTSCAPMFEIDYKLINDSNHAVTFISVVQPGFWYDHPDGITLDKAKDTLFFRVDGMGTATFDRAKEILLWKNILGETVTFTFDDGKQLVYRKEDGKGPYDFEGDHYGWITKRGHFFLVNYDYYGCLSYTITQKDYYNAQLPDTTTNQ